MKEGKTTVRVGEAIVLQTWPFHEADLLVSLFTREFGKIKGVARHAMRSRRRFGGALEPTTYVRATWAERPKQELARLDGFEILNSPMTGKVDFAKLAGLELVAEILGELPDGVVEDTVFRLAVTVLSEIEVGQVLMPVTYFCLWMMRLMGWMPELGRCVVCGVDLRGRMAWYSAVTDGVTCADDRKGGSTDLAPHAVTDAQRMFRGTVKDLREEDWRREGVIALRRFAVSALERHLEKRLASARTLDRGEAHLWGM